MRSAKDFFRPLAMGAPAPLREIPVRPSRVIHFFDPSNAKMAAKVPDLVGTVDILLGNLEDGVKAENKIAALEGPVSYTHLDVYKRQPQRACAEPGGRPCRWPTRWPQRPWKASSATPTAAATRQSSGCLLYTSRCV